MGYHNKEDVLQILLHEIYNAVNGNQLERVEVLSRAYQRITSITA